ncbi:hypothetical protein FACS1894217_07780 [Clostridia bacterium]|nr:hypothetical protein FACS1894217_07780 [Clostridia bacterium]
MSKQTIEMEQISLAAQTLIEYKTAKLALERRVLEDEKWYKMRHWDVMRTAADAGRPEPASAWLFNVIVNKHADVMDHYPTPEVLPRARDDEKEAKNLSAILPAILDRCSFQQKYSDNWWEKLKHGTAIYGAFWNPLLENGRGDVDVRQIDLLNIFWEPEVSDIQQSKNLFIVELAERDALPDDINDGDLARFFSDPLGKRVAVVDWYYKRAGVLHYCKFCGDKVLFSSENQRGFENGFYAHGRYPVVFDKLFPEKATPTGFGYISVCKNPQLYIDKLGQNILEASLMGSRVRYFVSESANVNEAEFMDFSKPLVRVAGNIDDSRLRQIQINPPVPAYLEVYRMKVDEMKETSGNRDFNSGGAGNGVTAAAAITAIQTAGGKLSRDMITAAFRAYADIGYLCVELIRQFYGDKRVFRVNNRDGYSFMDYSNAGMRGSVFDLKIKGVAE